MKPLRALLSAFRGQGAAPKARYSTWATDTAAEFPYAGLDENYRFYRADSLVRSCVNALAFFATSRGFETELAPADPAGLSEAEVRRELERPEWREVKSKVDRVNARVNLDQALFTAVVKMKVFGHAGFEVVRGADGLPERLIPLRSEDLKPDLDEDWRLTGYTYRGRKGFYAPGEVLYFANHQLEADRLGLSDVEPVRDALATRRLILQEALKESAKVLWAGVAILKVNTRGLSPQEADRALRDVAQQVKPGKFITVNQDVDANVVNLDPKLERLVRVLEYLDTDVIGALGVPRFLLNRERPGLTRATSVVEFKAFIEGPVSGVQRMLKRTLEASWYPALTRRALGLAADEEPPIKIRHQWNLITAEDAFEMADMVMKLWGPDGGGPIGGDRRKVWQLMRWDLSELEG